MTSQPNDHSMPEHEEENGLDRRGFLRASALLGACFADSKSLRAALAYAKAQGKPVLTQNTLNSFLASAHNLPASTKQQMAAEAKSNIGAFLSKHFALTAAQQHVIASYTAKDRSVLQQAIDNAIDANAKINVTISHPQPPKSAPRRPLPPRGRIGGLKKGGAADWKHQWLQAKLSRDTRGSRNTHVVVGDNMAASMALKAYAHAGAKISSDGKSEYSGEVGVEATC